MNFTKSIPALIFLVTACVIFSCHGQSGTKNMVADAGSVNPTASDVSAPNATFSYNLDGTKVSGGEVDEILLNNAVYITKSENNTEKFSFFLSDAYKSNTETFAHSLRFAIPNKPGTTTLTPDEDHWNVELFLSAGEDSKYVVYSNDAFTVTLIRVLADRVSGTFSGKMKLLETTGKGKPELMITDGKFDIPVHKAGK